MVSSKKCCIIGYIYSATGIVVSMWGLAGSITHITADNDTGSDDRKGELFQTIMVIIVCLLWLLFSVVLVIGIFKERIKFVKAHKTCLISLMVLWLVFAILVVLLQILFDEDISGFLLALATMGLLSLIIGIYCAVALRIVNRVIQYVENTQSTREHLLPMITAMLFQSDAEAEPTKPEFKVEVV